MKISLATILTVAALGCSAHALTITVAADLLKSNDGSPMPVNGLVVLTTLASGSTFGPTADSFTSEGELLLAKWDLSEFAIDGVLSAATEPLSFSGDWGAGDPLRLYWFPTLTMASLEPGAGTYYGTYSNLAGIDGTDPWVTIDNEAGSINLAFLTEDGIILPGSNPASAGLANFQVPQAPDNGSALGLFGATAFLLLGMASRRGVRPTTA